MTGQRNIEPSLTTSRQDTVSVIAQVTVPLYQGGAVSSRVKEATETAGQRQQEVDQARKQAIESTRRSWQSLVAARANVTARQAQIRAAETALDGVRQELASGSRTVLDLLNAEQELLDSRVSLVRGQRDELAAAFQLLAAIGRFGPDELRLSVDRYDPTTNYDEARGRWR
jgi:outer membrane protein TolC